MTSSVLYSPLAGEQERERAEGAREGTLSGPALLPPLHDGRHESGVKRASFHCSAAKVAENGPPSE